MTSLTLDLDQLQAEMQALLSPLGPVSICSCCLVDPNLTPDQHLSDCEPGLFHDDSSCSNSQTSEPIDRRRKHREAMARLRRGWRMTIAALQHHEERLQVILRRMATVPVNTTIEDSISASDPLASLRQSYRELVAEQLRLEDEHENLEAARAQRDKYERLLQRELARVRLFHASVQEKS